MRIPYDQMYDVFLKILLKYGFPAETASAAAALFTDNSCDGVASHGVNRFPRTLSYIRKGHIDPHAQPVLEASFGALERWNGNRGMGCTNASFAMERAMRLSDSSGIGCVAIRNTNHWMRGGAYGLQAARAGYMGICWTNTTPNMPPWGATECRIGNNPLVMGFPLKDAPLVIDGALAQFSYGALEGYRMAGKQLPVPGGYDAKGNLTTDPASIEETKRVLPIGFWKGSGYSMALDLIGAVLSGGNAVHQIGQLQDEIAVTQVFIAFSTAHAGGREYVDPIAESIIADIKKAEPVVPGGEIFYPGEKAGRTRRENLEQGIPVVEEIWTGIIKELE
jgi:3-dehydro-L-gulonate 2-dehydrogenase